MNTWRERVRREIREIIPVTLFFFIAFEMLALTRTLMLEEYGIRRWTVIGAAVGALIIAKVIVIADHIPFVDRFPNKPLIYNIAWKSAIYFVGSVIVRYAEHVIHFWRETGGFAEANRRLASEIVWQQAVCVQMWLAVLLLVYCTSRELIRALGRDRVIALLFTGRRPAESGNASESTRP